MIPPFEQGGNLPPGIHEAEWHEFENRYGGSAHRNALLGGLRDALALLLYAGCRRAYVNGSFVSTKEEPGDFDVCWEVEGVDADLLDPVLLDFSHRRHAQKERFGGELFPADMVAEPAGARFLEYFQRDRDTGEPKGIVQIDLEGLT